MHVQSAEQQVVLFWVHVIHIDLHDVHAVECLAWMDVHALACTRCYGANGLPLPTETSATPQGSARVYFLLACAYHVSSTHADTL